MNDALERIRTNPRAGDEVGGPMIKCTVHKVVYSQDGIEKVIVFGSGKDNPYPADEIYAASYSLSRWYDFVGDGAVILNEGKELPQ